MDGYSYSIDHSQLRKRQVKAMRAKLSKITKVMLIFLSVCVVMIVLTVAYLLYTMVKPTNDRDNADSHKQQEMVKIILKCGELAPIPKEAMDKTVVTEGNMFTRSYRLKFKANANTIYDWLHSSKGIKSAKLVKTGNNEQYILNIKYDFQYGEVRVDYSNNQVFVYLSKS